MPDWVAQLLGYAASAAALYAGIRVDLARLHERASIALARADSAHDRLNNLNT